MVKKKLSFPKFKLPKVKLPKLNIKRIVLDKDRARYIAKVLTLIVLILFVLAIMMQLGYVQ